MLESTQRREQVDLRLLRRYHTQHDLAARDEMVRRGLPLVRTLARPYSGRGEQLDDLVQVGTIGLVKAIDRFDPAAKTRFVTFAAPNITGEIKRHFRDHCWSLHVPRSVQELDARITRVSSQMAAQSGRTPTVADLARELDLPTERISEAMVGGQSYRALSLDHPAGEARDAIELIGEAEDGFAAVERRQTVRDACSVLDDREREMVFLRYFHGQLQREIAERFGVSQMQVSRILARALTRMRAYLAAAQDLQDAQVELPRAA